MPQGLMNPNPDDPSEPATGGAEDARSVRPARVGRFSADDLRPDPATPARPRLPPRLTDEDLVAPRPPRSGAGAGFEAVDLEAVKQRRAQRLQQNLPPGSPFRRADPGGGQGGPATRAASGGRSGASSVDAEIIDVPAKDVQKASPPSSDEAGRSSGPRRRTGWSPGVGQSGNSASAGATFFDGVAATPDRGGVPTGGTAATRPSTAHEALSSGAGVRSAITRSGSGLATLDARWLRECGQVLAATAAGVFLVAMGWTYLGAWGVLPLLTLWIWGLSVWSARLAQGERTGLATLAAVLSTVGVPLWVYALQIGSGVWDDLPTAPQAWPWALQVTDGRRVVLPALSTVWAWRRFRSLPRPLLLVATGIWLWLTMLEAAMLVMGRHAFGVDYLAQVTGLYGLALVAAGEWLARTARLLRVMDAGSAQVRPIDAMRETCGRWLAGSGLLMVWLAGWSHWPQQDVERWFWLSVHVGALVVGLRWRRRMWVVLGAVGLGLAGAAWVAGPA